MRQRLLNKMTDELHRYQSHPRATSGAIEALEDSIVAYGDTWDVSLEDYRAARLACHGEDDLIDYAEGRVAG